MSLVAARRAASTHAGFTLVEVLVSMAVIILLLTMLLQMTNNTIGSIHVVRQEMDVSAGERAVFDSLRQDLSNLVSDHGYTILVKQGGDNRDDTEIAFLTYNRCPASPTASAGSATDHGNMRFLAVDYQFLPQGKNGHSPTGQVVRNALPVFWNDPATDPYGASYANLQEIATNAASSANATSSVLADAVLRFEAVAVLDGPTPGATATVVPMSLLGGSNSAVVAPATDWWSATFGGKPISNGFYALNLTTRPLVAGSPKVHTLIVGMAVVSTQAYTLPNVAVSNGMPAKLVSPGVNATPYDVWSASLNDGSLGSYPRPALQTLHLGQQAFLVK